MPNFHPAFTILKFSTALIDSIHHMSSRIRRMRWRKEHSSHWEVVTGQRQRVSSLARIQVGHKVQWERRVVETKEREEEKHAM